MNDLNEKYGKLPAHDFSVRELGDVDIAQPITAHLIITEKENLFENVGVLMELQFGDKFTETGEYTLDIKKTVYPEKSVREIKRHEDELVELIEQIVGINISRGVVDLILKKEK
jgi:hypothetical protein